MRHTGTWAGSRGLGRYAEQVSSAISADQARAAELAGSFARYQPGRTRTASYAGWLRWPARRPIPAGQGAAGSRLITLGTLVESG